MFASAEDNDFMLKMAGLVLGFLGTALTGILTYFVAKLNTKQKEAAVETAMVKETLATNNEISQLEAKKIADKLEDVHKATNGMMKKIEEASFERGVKSETDKHVP